MFSAFTVLFIGYSYGDLVMQYLGRSLGPEGARFVFTHREDLLDWRSYGLTPVVYKAPANSHVALSETLERWAELASLGQTEHRRYITDIISSGRPVLSSDEATPDDEDHLQPEQVLTPEEGSYLEDSLGDPERIKYFVEAARGSYWLSWVATRPQFNHLFHSTEPTDERTAAVTNAITAWITDHYVTVENESPTALRAMRDRQWSHATLATITHRLFTRAKDGVVPTWQTAWLLLVLQQTPAGPNDGLDLLLNTTSWRDRPELALLLFEHRTRPLLVRGIDWGESTAPGFLIDLVGDEYWLTAAWTNVFKPMLGKHTHAILDLVIEQLRTVHRIAQSMHPEARADAISYRRSAIEIHEQEDIRDSMDVLIDAARDCLERLLDDDPAAGAARIESWAKADESIIRRLAVHGWRLRDDRNVNEKLRWVRRANQLHDLDAQHEVFLLLEAVVPNASDDEVQALLEQVRVGPAPVDGKEPSPYLRYNLLAWLARVAPAVTSITDVFNEYQAVHPEYEPRDHPDLNMFMTAGVVENAEPFSVDELHADIGHTPDVALIGLRSFQSIPEYQLTGPTWRGAIQSLQNCVARYPADGLKITSILEENDREFRTALIDAWAEAELDDEQVAAVVAVIDSWEVNEVRDHASRMLAGGGRDGRPTVWHRYPQARSLATNLWPSHKTNGGISESDDQVMKAINHPAGDLAQFWTRVVQDEWRQNQETWSGIPTDIRAQLDLMVQPESPNGLMACTILGSDLHFYFAADPEWTRTHLLVLFDWDTHPDKASTVWQGFLWRGRSDDGLLEAGLLNFYLQSCDHTEELGRQRYQAQLADHLALVAMFASPNPTTWLAIFIKRAPEDLRETWASRVASRLSELAPEEADHQWSRWVSEYWAGRVDSVPLPLTVAEASKMARWVLGLPTQRKEAVNLVKRSPAGILTQGSLLARLAEEDLATDATTWSDFIAHLLFGTLRPPSWNIGHYLPQIMGALKRADPPPNLAHIIDAAMSLGYTNAAEW